MTHPHPSCRRLNGLITTLILITLIVGQSAMAHHGWAWAEGEKTEITGTITEGSLGNPHGEVMLDVDGEQWLVEVGQPWRNERAGLTDDLLGTGTRMTVIGNRATNADELVIKAVRVVIDGEEFVLYPTR